MSVARARVSCKSARSPAISASAAEMLEIMRVARNLVDRARQQRRDAVRRSVHVMAAASRQFPGASRYARAPPAAAPRSDAISFGIAALALDSRRLCCTRDTARPLATASAAPERDASVCAISSQVANASLEVVEI